MGRFIFVSPGYRTRKTSTSILPEAELVLRPTFSTAIMNKLYRKIIR